MAGPGNSTPKRISAAESRYREQRAVALRRAGVTYEQIAEQLGYKDASGARYAFLRGLRRIAPPDTVEEARALELDRLDRLHMAWWPRAVGLATDADGRQLPAELKAADFILRLAGQRSRILGLDRINVDVSGEVEMVNRDGTEIVRTFLAELAQRGELILEPGDDDVLDVTPVVEPGRIGPQAV